ncbi:MAG: SIS domain-containing protein [Granulosicoccus sp.]
MLNFNEQRYRTIQSGAVSLAQGIDETVSSLLDNGADNIFFLGTGGVAFLMKPAVTLLERQSRFPAITGFGAELVITGSPHLTDKSIVVIPSLSGTTKESIELLDYIKSKGAKTISLVGHKETPLGINSDHAFVNFAEDDTSSESFYIQSLLIALSIMKHRGEIDNYDRLLEEIRLLPGALLEAKRAFESKAPEIAGIIDSYDYHIFTGAGNSWPEAHYYGMCILEEMQWILTRPVHASDFFHGSLELIEKGVSIFVLQGEDACRPLTERVISFSKEYTDSLTIIDTKDVNLPGIGAELRALISPAVLAAIFERVSAHLEIKRDHPLTTRRYYKKVNY